MAQMSWAPHPGPGHRRARRSQTHARRCTSAPRTQCVGAVRQRSTSSRQRLRRAVSYNTVALTSR
eukprot:14245318-Alexandrium_andersonii.AAC.1